MPHRAALNALVEVVLQDADRGCRRAEDRALNEARRLVTEAEDHVRELSDAALSLGRVRGEAARAAAQQAAERAVAGLRSNAFEQLYDRFTRRLSLAIQSLPDTLPDMLHEEGAYESALRHWGAEAAAIDGPFEVFTAKRDRLAVYEALLDAGATDFSVHIDRLCKAGFVVRDLDGRVVLDRRPDALIGENEAALRALLSERVPAFE